VEQWAHQALPVQKVRKGKLDCRVLQAAQEKEVSQAEQDCGDQQVHKDSLELRVLLEIPHLPMKNLSV
jgi:hypothetical protein